MLTIKNEGATIVESNFWQSDVAKAGKFVVSCNAGAMRVLLPDRLAGMPVDVVLQELLGAYHVVAERRDGLLQLWFEDGTPTPFMLETPLEGVVDHLPKPGERGFLTVWIWRGRPTCVFSHSMLYQVP